MIPTILDNTNQRATFLESLSLNRAPPGTQTAVNKKDDKLEEQHQAKIAPKASVSALAAAFVGPRPAINKEKKNEQPIKSSWLTAVLLSNWLLRQPKSVRHIAWEIGYHLSVVGGLGGSSIAAGNVLWELRKEPCPGLEIGPPDAWYKDWFGSTEDRRRAAIGARIRSEDRPPWDDGLPDDQLLLYQCKFLTPAESTIERLIALAGKGCISPHLLVAARRLIDKILVCPRSLEEALKRHKQLLARCSPDHNYQTCREDDSLKWEIYHYFSTIKTLKSLLEDPAYGDAIFSLPPGDLGLKNRHVEQRIIKVFSKTLIVSTIVIAVGCAVVGVMYTPPFPSFKG